MYKCRSSCRINGFCINSCWIDSFSWCIVVIVEENFVVGVVVVVEVVVELNFVVDVVVVGE